MKKLITLFMITLLLVGCSNKKQSVPKTEKPKTDSGSLFSKSDPFENYYGTWRTSAIETKGVRFTREQFEALGAGDNIDYIFTINKDGILYGWSKSNNLNDSVNWIAGENNEYISAGDVNIYYEDGEIYFDLNEEKLFLEKISDRQDAGIIDELIEKDAETPEPEKKEEVKEEKQETSSNTIRPDVKEAIDAYEDFVDEYIEFMKKYESSDGTDLSILTDYVEFMSKLTDYTDKMEDMEDDLTDAEYIYYMEVLNRCNTKMMKALN